MLLERPKLVHWIRLLGLSDFIYFDKWSGEPLHALETWRQLIAVIVSRTVCCDFLEPIDK